MLSRFELQRNLFATSISDTKLLQMNIARDVSDNPEYVGYSSAGTPEDETGWLIIKYTYTGTNIDKSRLADDSMAFDKIWDDRAGYSYS